MLFNYQQRFCSRNLFGEITFSVWQDTKVCYWEFTFKY